MSHIYISYHPQDVDRLFSFHEALRKQNIADEFLTYEGDQPQFTDTNRQQISRACAVVCLVTHASLESETLKKEVAFAREMSLPVYCAVLEPLKMPPAWASIFREASEFYLIDGEDRALAQLLERLRTLYETRCPVVAVMNLKGGVGKTTISSQVFGTLQHEKRNKILFLDFDPQFNLTQFFLTREESDQRISKDQSVLSLFEPGLLTSNVHPSPALDWTSFNLSIFTPPRIGDIARSLIPANEYTGSLDLICGQFELTKFAFLENSEALQLAESNLKQCIDRYRRHYDLIVIDTNPSASFMTRATLGVTDHILAPILSNEYSLRGLRLLDMILNRFAPENNRPDLSVIFNGVPKSQQNRFETDARDGLYDREVGFALSKSILSSALYQSSYLELKSAADPDAPLSRLAIRSAKGPFASDLKGRLSEIVHEFTGRLPN